MEAGVTTTHMCLETTSIYGHGCPLTTSGQHSIYIYDN